MYGSKKERLEISDLVENPAISYPRYYNVSRYLMKNEIFHDALIALHSCDFGRYNNPKDASLLFNQNQFSIYKENYIVGFFGGKLMFLEASGWKSLPATEDIFDMKNWLVCW